MYAVIKIAGFQYRVEEGQVLQVPQLTDEAGASLTLDEVLLLGDGDAIKVGAPTVDGASVSAEVLSHGRGPKMTGGRFLRRKDYRRKWGYRQNYTEIKIGSIQG